MTKRLTRMSPPYISVIMIIPPTFTKPARAISRSPLFGVNRVGSSLRFLLSRMESLVWENLAGEFLVVCFEYNFAFVFMDVLFDNLSAGEEVLPLSVVEAYIEWYATTGWAVLRVS